MMLTPLSFGTLPSSFNQIPQGQPIAQAPSLGGFDPNTTGLLQPNTLGLNQQQQPNGFTTVMPGFNNLPILPGVAQPPSSPLPAFDYGGLNVLNNNQTFLNNPYVTQVPVQGFIQLGDGRFVPSTQYTAYMPSVVPGSITNLQQLASLPGGSSTSLGAVLQLAGISPNVLGASGFNRSGALLPPIFGLQV